MQITARKQTCAQAIGHRLRHLHFKMLLGMKLLLVLLFATSLQLFGRTAAQNVTLKASNSSLEKVFKEIRKQTGYDFVFNARFSQNAKPVTIDVKNMPLEEVLKQCVKDQPFTYQIVDKMIVIKEKALSEVVHLSELAPLLDVKGVVRDESGKPAAGVTVMIKGTSRGTSTNDRGEFTLHAVPENATLVFSSVNLQSFEVRITSDKSTDLAITLKAKISELADVTIASVNTGYQTISRDRVNGSYFVMDSAAINRRVSTDAISRLEAMVPGLLFNRNAANTSTGYNLSVRGHSTILANDQPLIVLDNFIYDGDLTNINPNDIETVTVLKDASAASIWGARSGNGVIVITTKKGKRYQPISIELNSNVTIGNKPDLYYSQNFIKSTDFIDIEKNLFSLGSYDADLASTSKPVVSPVAKILAKLRAGQISSGDANQQIDAFRSLDIRDDLTNYLLQKSINQQYSLNIKAGGLASDYFLSFGYDNNRSSYVASSKQRVTVTGLSNFFPVKGLTLSAGIYYVQSNTLTNNVAYNSIKSTGKSSLYPYAQLVDGNGKPAPLDHDFSSSYTDTVGAGKLASWRYSPLEELGLNNDKTNLTDNRINLGAKYSFLNGLSIEGKFQYQKSSTTRKDYERDSSYASRYLYNRFTNLTTGAHPVPASGILGLSNGNLVSYRSRLQINYNHAWGIHSINVIAGAEINSSKAESSSNTLYGYNQNTGTFQNLDIVSSFTTNPTGSAKIPSGLGIGETNDRFLSYFSNGYYLFKNKYSVTASARIDKSNLFGVNTNQKSIPLYSVSAGWEFYKEKWVKTSWLNMGKLRVTYGYNGNLNRNVAAVTTFNNLSSSYINLIPYSTISNYGNPELRWERISMINIGLDFSVLNNRLSGSIEYYSKKGNDLFGQAPNAASSGVGILTGNFASSKGSGFDITLRSINVKTKNIQWSTDLIFSQAKDMVTKYAISQAVSTYLTSGDNNSGSTYIPLQGKPLFAIYSYRFAGLDANGDPLGYLNGKPSKDWPSIISNTTLDSMIFNGNSRPAIFGSLRNTVSYKGFSLSFNLIYKFGYYFKRSSMYVATTVSKSWTANADYYNRWQKPGDEAYTNVPALQYPPTNDNRSTFYSNSSALVEKGDHIRLQDINLSYQFPNKSAKALGFSSLSLYSYLNNVGLIWRANKYHLDPDINSTSSSDVPIPFSIAFGLKVIF